MFEMPTETMLEIKHIKPSGLGFSLDTEVLCSGVYQTLLIRTWFRIDCNVSMLCQIIAEIETEESADNLQNGLHGIHCRRILHNSVYFEMPAILHCSLQSTKIIFMLSEMQAPNHFFFSNTWLCTINRCHWWPLFNHISMIWLLNMHRDIFKHYTF